MLPLLDKPNIRTRREIRATERLAEQVPGILRRSLDACISGARQWPLYVCGTVGAGKTCAALALCDRVDGLCKYRDFGELCDEFQRAKFGLLTLYGTHAESSCDSNQFWTDWRDAALCVVDDIGVRGHVSDHQYDTLKRALDTRLGCPLILISNLDLDSLARSFDDRIASRCAAGTVVSVEGPDRRLERHLGPARPGR